MAIPRLEAQQGRRQPRVASGGFSAARPSSRACTERHTSRRRFLHRTGLNGPHAPGAAPCTTHRARPAGSLTAIKTTKPDTDAGICNHSGTDAGSACTAPWRPPSAPLRSTRASTADISPRHLQHQKAAPAACPDPSAQSSPPRQLARRVAHHSTLLQSRTPRLEFDHGPRAIMALRAMLSRGARARRAGGTAKVFHQPSPVLDVGHGGVGLDGRFPTAP